MGFRKLRLFEITTEVGSDGYPVYAATPIRLQGATNDEDFNSVSIKLTAVKKSKTLVADDKEKIKEIETGYDVELEVLGVDPDAAKEAFGYTKDIYGNIKEVVNGTKKKFGLFFEGKTATGAIFQKYLYKLQFSTPDEEQQSDAGENVVTVKLTAKGEIITDSEGNQVKGYTVYSGNPGYIAGAPTEMHKFQDPCIVTFTVKDEENVDIASPTITVKFGNTVITAEANGTYKCGIGTYSYTVAKTGYVTETGTVAILSTDPTKTVDVVLKAEEA